MSEEKQSVKLDQVRVGDEVEVRALLKGKVTEVDTDVETLTLEDEDGGENVLRASEIQGIERTNSIVVNLDPKHVAPWERLEYDPEGETLYAGCEEFADHEVADLVDFLKKREPSSVHRMESENGKTVTLRFGQVDKPSMAVEVKGETRRALEYDVWREFYFNLRDALEARD